MKTKTYINRQKIKVDAIQFTGDNIEEIKEFCGMYGSSIYEYVEVGDSKIKAYAFKCDGGIKDFFDEGDYFFMDRSLSWMQICSSDDFTGKYENA